MDNEKAVWVIGTVFRLLLHRPPSCAVLLKSDLLTMLLKIFFLKTHCRSQSYQCGVLSTGKELHM